MRRCKSLGSLIWTSAIWSQYPVFLHPEFPQGSPWGVAAVWWLLDGRYSFLPEFPQGSPAHTGGLQVPMTVTSFVYWCGRQYSISQGLHLVGQEQFNFFVYLLKFFPTLKNVIMLEMLNEKNTNGLCECQKFPSLLCFDYYTTNT